MYLCALELIGEEMCKAEIRWAEDQMHCAALFKLVENYVVTDEYGYIYHDDQSDGSGRMNEIDIRRDEEKVRAVISKLYN